MRRSLSDSFFLVLGGSCQYQKEHSGNLVSEEKKRRISPGCLFHISIFKLFSWNSNIVLATAFHIPPAYFQHNTKTSQNVMKSPPRNELAPPLMKAAIAMKKASPLSYKRVARQDIVIARHSGRKATQSDNEVTIQTPSMIPSVESCPNFPSLLALPLQQQDINSIGIINSADEATSARTVLRVAPVAPRAPSITDALEEEDDDSPRFKLRPKFYQMVREMIRFNAESVELLRLDPADPRRRVCTGQYLRNHGYSETFAAYYLLPMMAALWSASIEDVLAFPAEQLIGFLCNHKMLQLFDRPQVSAKDEMDEEWYSCKRAHIYHCLAKLTPIRFSTTVVS